MDFVIIYLGTLIMRLSYDATDVFVDDSIIV